MRVVTLVIPKGNPDFDDRYERVTSWWLEVGADGQVQREIGFDAAGHAVVAAPLGRNLGIFTDLDGALERLGDLVDPSQFERLWSELQKDFPDDAYTREAARLRRRWHVVLGVAVAATAGAWILSLVRVLPPGTLVFVAFCAVVMTLTLLALHFKCPRCGNPLDIARPRGFPAECDVCHLRLRQGLK